VYRRRFACILPERLSFAEARIAKMAKASINELISRRELIWNLVLRSLRIRYKGSALGFLWTLLNPLMMMLIYWLFISILRFEVPLSHLLTGVIFWQFMAMCTSDAVGSVTGFPNLVKKTYFPRMVLPLSMVIANFINFTLSMVVLGVILTFMKFLAGTPVDFSFLWMLPFVLAIQFCLVLGIALVVSSANVFFRDIEHIVGVVLQALFFLTPIIYPLSFVRERISGFKSAGLLLSVYLLNPLASLVTLFRKAFLGRELVSGGGFLPPEPAFYVSLGLCAIILFVGIRVFQKLEPHFADHI
jgi:ABC-type polysaccharide/polyol phosphate export permease